MTQLPPQNLKAEEAVLGAMLVAGSAVDAVLGGTSLRSEHFYRPRHGRIFQAIGALAQRGEPVDSLTVADELGGDLEEAGGAEVLSGLADHVAVPGNASHYAQLVVDKATWRTRLAGAEAITAAVTAEDEAALADAESLLRADVGRADCEFDSDRQAERIWAMVEGDATPTLPWPFERLTRARSIRRGNFIVLSGLTSTGKSLYADMMLDTWKKHGHRCCLYMNEMDVDERLVRRVVRHAGVPAHHIESGKLKDDEQQRVLAEVNRNTWPMVQIAGWTATEVAHHIRRQRWEGCVVDLLNRFPINAANAEREYAGIVNTLADAAKLSESAVVLVAQVNRGSVQGHTAQRRKPTVFDLKGSGDIETHADVVAFVHRDRDEEGEMELDGEVYFDKARGGALETVPVTLNESRLRFERGRA